MPEMPCPFCGAHTTVLTIENHIYRKHPHHAVYLFPPVALCEHRGFQPMLFRAPVSSTPSFATPMMVN